MPHRQLPWRLLLAASVSLALTPSTRGAAGDWSRFRGADGQGQAGSQKPPAEWGPDRNVQWKIALPGPGGSSPAVHGERVFVTCYSGYAVPGNPPGELGALRRHLLCLNRTDGRLLWTRDIPAEQPEQDKVRDHGYASSTPFVDAERVYVFFGKSGVFAFDHDGKEEWRAKVGDGIHGWGSASSPVVHKDLLIVNAAVESESLVALEKATGRERWRAGGMKESWNTPILAPAPDGRQELVVAVLGKVLGFDPDSGQPLWSCATGIGWYMVPSLVHDRDTVYCIGGRTGGSLAVRTGGRGDVTASHRRWTLNKGSNVPSPLLHDGHLYWFHENLGIAYCAEAATGRVVYEERLPKAGPIYASPLLADGRIYAITRNGIGFVLAAQPRFELMARNELGDRSSFDASPAADGDRLLVRSDRFLYCIAAPTGGTKAPSP